MRRREKFIISSTILALSLLGIQYIPLEYRLLAFLVFFIASYLVSAAALYEDLFGVEWITIVPFPAMYAVAVGLFNFLLPNNLLSRFFILGLFGVGMYAQYLTANIYSVAKIRTIQLLRAAQTIGFFFTLLTSTLLTNFLFSLRLDFWWNGLIIFAIHFPLILMSLWSVDLSPRVERRIWLASGVFALVMAELGIIFSFCHYQSSQTPFS